MKIAARWGRKVFFTSAQKIVPLENLSTSFALKQDANNDTSGTPSTNTTGRELQSITFETFYARVTGCDPRTELDEWYALIGAAYTLYIGGKQFGPDKLQLTDVSVKETQLAPNGTFLALRLAITLTEYQAQEDKISTKPKTAQETGTTTVGMTATVADSLGLAKVKALSAKASELDKRGMKPSVVTNSQVQRVNR